MIKILAIGNSFSQDATAQIELLEPMLHVRNLYIGGCSLESHAVNILSGAEAYSYQHNGESAIPNNVSIKDAILSDKWDYITVQQRSGHSGLIDTYYPHLSVLTENVRKYSDAEIIFHRTWSYEKNSSHEDFALYNNDYKLMYEKIVEASATVCEKENLRMIDVGSLIHKLRNYEFFDVDKNGISIQRDGFHLSYNYGRLAAACVWIKFFTGNIPDFLKRDDLSDGFKIILNEIKNL